MKSQSPQLHHSKCTDPNRLNALSADRYEPGDFVSTDQFVVSTPGRLERGYGRESKENSYHGGTLHTDAASGLIKIVPQVSLGAGETLLGKSEFEQWMWDIGAVNVKHYHSNNGVYAADLFKADCREKSQSQSFSGTYAHHQNAYAERAIQTMSYWACTMMVHASLHWPSDGADEIRLWPFVMQHAAWVYNHLPN